MSRLEQGWIAHLRNISRQKETEKGKAVERPATGRCPLCRLDVVYNLETFKSHVVGDASRHAGLATDTDIQDAFDRIIPNSPCVPFPISIFQRLN